ncbi:hypothetical protein [Paenibacillus sp. 481]|uniref:hypothetical protein n=1 Tax=Paenibacillus sp. 481 TaxID=2835869 RepID=UPI001E416A9C|nr:hypothetical protein [Paenibacillus sp. 481]UHA73767.1 hypothetical protein KIK04_00925 [Paenibacillus sp. 481]
MKNSVVYTSDGVLYESVCVWNQPAIEHESDRIFDWKGWGVPTDFKSFLMIQIWDYYDKLKFK